MRNFNLLGVDELSQEPYFRRWVLGELRPDDNFWEEWILANPDKKQVVDEAKSLVIGLQAVEKEVFSKNEINDGIRQILIDTNTPVKRFNPLGAMWFRVAASVVIVLSFGWWIWESRFVSAIKLPKEVTAQQETVHRNDADKSKIFILSDGSKITLGSKET